MQQRNGKNDQAQKEHFFLMLHKWKLCSLNEACMRERISSSVLFKTGSSKQASKHVFEPSRQCEIPEKLT